MKKLSVGICLLSIPSVAFASENNEMTLIIGIGGMAIITAIVVIVNMNANKSAADPNRGDYADLDAIFSKVTSQLNNDFLYDLDVVRQSGNIERTVKNLDTQEAINQVTTTMRRAKIDLVSVSGDENFLRIYRMSHNARGRKEGKRIGGFEIRKNGLLSPQNTINQSVMANDQNTMITLNTFEHEEQKSIVKSFFKVFGHFDDDLPEAIVSTFDQETGEGNDDFDFMDIVKLLIIADFHLSGSADLTDEGREQFKSSDVDWQKKIGNDESIKSINGIMLYSNTSPDKIQLEFIRLWEMCEQLVSKEQYGSDELDGEFQSLHYSFLEENRPKILDMEF